MIVIKPQGGKSELVDAAFAGHHGRVSELLDELGPIKAKEKQYFHRAFWIACVKCHLRIAQLFLEKGADPDTYYISGSGSSSVLHLAVAAAMLNHRDPASGVALARLLLDHGANSNPGRNSTGQTPLTLATYHKNRDLVELLLNRGAQVDDRFTSKKWCPGETPLFMTSACSGTNAIEIAKLLLHHGAKLNVTCGFWSETPLHRAAMFGGCTEIMSALLNQSTCTENIINAKDRKGRTPLHVAVQSQNSDKVRMLLEAGADPSAHDNCDETALHLCCKSESASASEIVQLLLDHGALVNKRDGHENTPLIKAVACRTSPEIVALLLRHGANPNIRGEIGMGYTPLHHAADDSISSNSTDALARLQLLLHHGANTTIPNSSGLIPLFLACKRGNLDSIFELFRLMVGQGCIDFYDIETMPRTCAGPGLLKWRAKLRILSSLSCFTSCS
jgi:ankyrin repeat protein